MEPACIWRHGVVIAFYKLRLIVSSGLSCEFNTVSRNFKLNADVKTPNRIHAITRFLMSSIFNDFLIRSNGYILIFSDHFQQIRAQSYRLNFNEKLAPHAIIR